MYNRNVADSHLEQLLVHRKGQITNVSLTLLAKGSREDSLTEASFSAIQATSFAINRMRLETLRRINEAIERWKRGRYGKCLRCKRRIRRPRLSVLPEAERCLPCQRTEEKKKNLRLPSPVNAGFPHLPCSGRPAGSGNEQKSFRSFS